MNAPRAIVPSAGPRAPDAPPGGFRLNEVVLAFKRISGSDPADQLSPLDLIRSSQRSHPLALGVRQFFAEPEGSGYADYFQPSDDILISITDATFRKDRWVEVPGGRFVKLRMLLSGKLLDLGRKALLEGRQAHLHVIPEASVEGYFFAGGQEAKLITLHCGPQFLQRTLGLPASELPPPLHTMAVAGASNAIHRIGFSSELLHAAQRMLDSRHGVPSALRAAYLESMATTMLCEVLAELSNRELVRSFAPGLSVRDINRVYEARDYLAQHFTAPPTIPELARMVGTNQTKLKSGFKEIFGITIYQYILERRMELASELLMTHNYNVAEIAYRVGYEYPTNFSFAFRKRFGCLPRTWKRRQ